MLFNSIDFVVFFPVVVALYFAIPYRWRWTFLLASSYYFYACWKLEYLALIMASTLIDYAAGRAMGRRETRAERRPFLLMSLCSNLGILFFFKYANFFGESVEEAFRPFNIFVDMPAFDILLPVGISFYTFQTLAYSIDVYRGRQQAERHLGIFAVYVCFWPQLVAGPIERSQSLLPQFRERHPFRWSLAADGLKLMAWGFFQKVVIADRAALYVGTVYANPEAYVGWTTYLAIVIFAVQIYCDFAGYTNIARGAARVMGYELMKNFRQPLYAIDIADFWRRWHISLTTWFRDYLYFPMGGSRVPKWRWGFNTFFVLAVCGLWHGASWTFVMWGVVNGVYLAFAALTATFRNGLWDRAEAAFARFKPRTETVQQMGVALPPTLWQRLQTWIIPTPRRFIRTLVGFHLIILSLIFFRATTMTDAWTMLSHLFSLTSTEVVVGINNYEFLLLLVSIAVLLLVDLIELRENIRSFLKRRPAWVRFPIYAALVLAILMLGEYGAQEFIYFQF
ncbi:MAG: MBOAT family O-acyltransferase [Bacteroidota bacterium]